MTKEEIQSYVDDNINPGLGMHGDFLTIQEYDTTIGVLYVTMGGGCQGCSSAALTLKQGIDQILKEEFPEIKLIEDTTQHHEGVNPFYT